MISVVLHFVYNVLHSISALAVAGVAVTAVLVLLVVAGVQSAVIWHLQRYKLKFTVIVCQHKAEAN